MARGNNNGWDFVKVGGTYQYKEDSWIAEVKVLKDNSDEKLYSFELQVEKSSWPKHFPKTFTLSHNKDFDGVYSGMNQIYETEEYMVEYKWIRGKGNV